MVKLWFLRLVVFWKRLFDVGYYEECKRCKSCEFLHEELVRERVEKKLLLDAILEAQRKPGIVQEISSVTPDPLAGYVPWHIRQKQLELADRVKYASMKMEMASREKEETSSTSTEQLEQELGLTQEVGDGPSS